VQKYEDEGMIGVSYLVWKFLWKDGPGPISPYYSEI
jgi:hypothetical protein